MDILMCINFCSVLIFGIMITLSFADIDIKDNFRQYIVICAIFGLLQLVVYYALGIEILFKSYPFVTHFPLILVLIIKYKKSIYISIIAVLSSYLFCTPRKWVGTLISSFFDYNINISYIVQILITIPLIYIIIKFITPYVANLRFEKNNVLALFLFVPLIYYILEYWLTVYTNLLYTGNDVVVEFMDAFIVLIYFIFSVIYLKILYKNKEIELEQALLKISFRQSIEEIKGLKKAQRQTAIYRHDLRHHLNFLNNCITENKLDDAKKYIQETFLDIENSKMIEYSENEVVNLIVSSYVNKAKNESVKIDIKITSTNFLKFTMSDLCSLISNALENAITAVTKINDCSERFITFNMFENNNKLCIDIRNSFYEKPIFKNGVPVAIEKDHGIGTKSMAYIVEKYNGVYEFSIENNVFIFMATL